jgi:hypothetical protein
MMANGKHYKNTFPVVQRTLFALIFFLQPIKLFPLNNLSLTYF